MSRRLEEYALIGDTETAALVARDGSIDWLCLPRFDSGACFAALLGDERHGRWFVGPPPERVSATRRRYRPGSLVLETEFDTPEGTVRLIDAMPLRGELPDVVRVVKGVRGRVRMCSELVLRFNYGRSVPWVRRVSGGFVAIAGPDAVRFQSPIRHHGEDLSTVAEFDVAEGDQVPFVLTWFPSHQRPSDPVDPIDALKTTDRWWSRWSARCEVGGRYRDLVMRSLVTLKALTYAPTGGVVAAPTTSLPEQIGGVRNWDYRACWLRDSTFTLMALMGAGYRAEASAFRDWLLRAVAGAPSDMQIMYGIAGERLIPELELPWLPGYESSCPVRIGNAASGQFQLDVYGELMDGLHAARVHGVQGEEQAWDVQQAVMEFLESAWLEPDEGIWEVRGRRRHFTHSKVMAWVAADRAVQSVEQFHLEGPVDRWKALRATIHDEVCREGVDPERGCFVQSYGSKRLDAALLMIPQVGFLAPTDERVVATIEAVQKELTYARGLVRRYETDGGVDGLPGDEGAFLACSFWLVDALSMIGRRAEATVLFDRIASLANDVGLLAEEYDAEHTRQVGNFPQAFSHVGLVNSALNLTEEHGTAGRRAAHARKASSAKAGAAEKGPSNGRHDAGSGPNR
jgi:GH15 family glucan-1,4-alpha-glucosidase